MKAVRVHAYGGPETLIYEDIQPPEPGPGEALVDLEFIGVNYSDTHYRRGTYPTQPLPLIPGHEGAGVISALGYGVQSVRVGDNVVFSGIHRRGTYCEQQAVPVENLISVPPGLGNRAAVAVLNQGCTAHYLAHDAHSIREGERVLIHAAAGGVGSNLVQIAKRLGAYVYATVSTEEKSKFARAIGADEVFVTSAGDFEEKVRRATDGKGVDAVFDAIGGDTFMKSMRSLARKGHLVTYGKTAGPPPPVEWPPQALGSLYLSYHTGQDYGHRGEQAQQRASTVFRWVVEGSLKVHVYEEYALNDAASAHRAIESRKTMGKLLLFTP